MSTWNPSGPGDPTGDARFRPGGTSEDEARSYGESVGVVPEGAGDGTADDTEDTAARAARLRRRRRLLTWGGAPAAVVLLVCAWLGAVSLLTLLGNRAAVHEDYTTAVSRYSAVETINPVLEQWRVHYNLGTAQLFANDLDAAASELEEALTTAPEADTITAQGSDGHTVSTLDPTAPECLVRVNLYAAHLGKAAAAQEDGDSRTASDEQAAATKAAGDCSVPPRDPSSDPSATPSGTPSSPPSQQPSQDSSTTASAEPSGSASPTDDPSSSASATPSQDPSAQASQSASAEPTSSPSVSEGPTSTPSPVDEKQKELDERNGDANDDGGSSVGGTKNW
ncbi:hypothetical protein [Actinomyces radicidentis]|uniref:hypothetical protein n=1 Tax=Actinomyces radicidentis TaxID=111015 RepID=UPI0028ED6FDF|nr:hypothetical protein [Actinomyces radicidentis]